MGFSLERAQSDWGGGGLTERVGYGKNRGIGRFPVQTSLQSGRQARVQNPSYEGFCIYGTCRPSQQLTIFVTL